MRIRGSQPPSIVILLKIQWIMKRFAIAAAIAATLACPSCRSKKQAESFTIMNDSACFSATVSATSRRLDAIRTVDDEVLSTSRIHFNDSAGKITIHADGSVDITGMAAATRTASATHTRSIASSLRSDSASAAVLDMQASHTTSQSHRKEEKSRGIPWDAVIAAIIAAAAIAMITRTIYSSLSRP